MKDCKKDYKGMHCWNYLGWDGKDLIAFRCSQCKLSRTERLDWDPLDIRMDYRYGLTPLELKLEKKFQDEHYKKHKRDHRKISFVPTGVGSAVEIECLICKKKKDITDYGSW
jgi:hypothetical protein